MVRSLWALLSEISFEYDENIFDWSNSKLYYFLCDHYGLNEVVITLKDNTEIFVEKYNVLGHRDGKKYITLYNNVGELEPLTYIDLDTIASCKIIERN